MTEEQNKKTPEVEQKTSQKVQEIKQPVQNAAASQKKERSWGDVATDALGNMVDAIASGKRGLAILGAGLAGAMNTKGFQQQQNKSAMELAAEQRRVAQHNMAMQMGQLKLDEAYRNEQMNIVNNNIKNELATNPVYGWNMFNNEEQVAILNSPAIKNLATGTYFFREALKSRNEPEAWGRVQRMITDAGGKVLDDGKNNYTVEIFGRSIPLNEQEGAKVYKNLQDAVLSEVEARRAISYNATRGNVVGKIQSDYVKKIIPYTNGLASRATSVFKDTLKGLTQNQRDIMFARRTLEDIFSPVVGNDEKTAEAEMALAKNPAGLSILERMGFKFNPGQAGLADATIVSVDNPNAAPMNLPQFAAWLKDNDSGSQILDTQFNSLKLNYDNNQKRLLAKGMFGGEDAKPKGISDKDNYRGFNTYGSNAWSKMTPEMKRNVFAAEDEVAQMALYLGLAELENGRPKIKEHLTQEQINKMRSLERNVFELYGLKDLVSKGYWAQKADVKKPEITHSSFDKKEPNDPSIPVAKAGWGEREELFDERGGMSMMRK
jgi:hypothetical protein